MALMTINKTLTVNYQKVELTMEVDSSEIVATGQKLDMILEQQIKPLLETNARLSVEYPQVKSTGGNKNWNNNSNGNKSYNNNNSGGGNKNLTGELFSTITAYKNATGDGSKFISKDKLATMTDADKQNYINDLKMMMERNTGGVYNAQMPQVTQPAPQQQQQTQQPAQSNDPFAGMSGGLGIDTGF